MVSLRLEVITICSKTGKVVYFCNRQKTFGFYRSSENPDCLG